MEHIKKILYQSLEIREALLGDDALLGTIECVSNEMTKAFRSKNKVLFCGNGGSAADAQHLAAELAGKFYLNRAPLPAEALHVNTSYLTAVANDFSYDEVFSRLVVAKGAPGDMLVAISTSGTSPNIINAVNAANDAGMITVGLTGKSGGRMGKICRHTIMVPSSDTPRIQEIHILIGHIICEHVENALFGGK